MHIEFLVEEESAAEALRILVPRIAGQEVSFRVHPFQGKADLLANLARHMKGYRAWMPEDWSIVVLADSDQEDCRKLKGKLEQIAHEAGFATRSRRGADGGYQVLNRLPVEELEAWFFGDAQALRAAYPRVPATLAKQRRYRNPDAIRGGTREALERILRRAGYYPGGMLHMEVARTIAEHMDPSRNASRSFQLFREALTEIARGDRGS